MDVLTPGVGIISAAYYLGKYLHEGDYDLAINAGICGSYDPGLVPGTVVHVTEERFPETGVDAISGFKTLEGLGLYEGDTFPFDKGVLYNDNFPEMAILSGLTEVSGNTVSTLLTDPDKIAALLERAPAQVESMEGAAFFFGCLLENMPAIQVRAIANFVGEQNRRK